MLAGYDEKVGPSLYLIDYLGSMHSMNMAGTGYGELLKHILKFKLRGYQSRAFQQSVII